MYFKSSIKPPVPGKKRVLSIHVFCQRFVDSGGTETIIIIHLFELETLVE